MKPPPLLALVVLSTLPVSAPSGTASGAPPTPAASITGYELPAVLEAGTLLDASLLRGSAHRVRDVVLTDGYLAQFIVDSDYGTYVCLGKGHAERRIAEIYAIRRLVEVSKGDLFAEGMKRSITQPIAAVKNIVTHPVESVKGLPSTVGHFFQKVGSSIESAAEGAQARSAARKENDAGFGEAVREEGAALGKAAKSVVGFDKAKLACARELGVDPYTDNARLQDEIEKVSWAFFAGGLPLRIVTADAATALRVTKAAGLPEAIYSLTPAEISLRNKQALDTMGVAEEVQKQFNASPLSLSQKFALVSGLARMEGVAGRAGVVQVASYCETYRQAEFLDHALQLLPARHKVAPYKSLIVVGRLVGGVTKDGTLEIPAPVEYISWTEDVAAAASRQDLAGTPRVLLLTGDASPLARANLEKTGWKIVKP